MPCCAEGDKHSLADGLGIVQPDWLELHIRLTQESPCLLQGTACRRAHLSPVRASQLPSDESQATVHDKEWAGSLAGCWASEDWGLTLRPILLF